jgi:O-antigen/teichoic acid export membrane protein
MARPGGRDLHHRGLRARLAKMLAGTSAKRGVAAIAGGAAIGQLIAFLAAPVLSRIYSPADFGVFSVISSAVLVLSTAFALRLELAIPLPRDDSEAYAIAILGILCSLIGLILGVCVIGWLGSRLAQLLNEQLLWPWLLMVPPMSALSSTYMVLTQLAIRNHKYRSIGRRNVLYSLATISSQLALGARWFAASGGLVIGLAIGQLTGVASMLVGSGLSSEPARSARSVKRWLKSLRRYKRFPLIAAPAGIINAAGLYAPAIVMVVAYGATFGGLFGLAQRLMLLPVGLLGTAIGQVYVAKLSNAARTGANKRISLMFYGVSKRLLLLGGACALPILVLGPWLFAHLFGPEWRESGDCARALALVLVAQMTAGPVSQTLMIFERQGLQLAWDAARLLLVIGSVATCSLLHLSGIFAVWTYSGASAVMYAISWLMTRSTVLQQRGMD